MALFQGKDADLVTDYWARLPEDPSIFAKEQSRVTGKQLWEEMGECSPGAPVSHLHWVSETVTPIKLGHSRMTSGSRPSLGSAPKQQ